MSLYSYFSLKIEGAGVTLTTISTTINSCGGKTALSKAVLLNLGIEEWAGQGDKDRQSYSFLNCSFKFLHFSKNSRKKRRLSRSNLSHNSN